MPKSPDAFRTISEVADWLGVQAHVLRFWESKFAQVKPIKRAGGRRYYRPADMLLLGGIKKLLHDDGLTIKGTQKLLREKGVAFVADQSQPLDDLTIGVIEGSTQDEVVTLEDTSVAELPPSEPDVTAKTETTALAEVEPEEEIHAKAAPFEHHVQPEPVSDPPDAQPAETAAAAADIDADAPEEASEVSDSAPEQLEHITSEDTSLTDQPEPEADTEQLMPSFRARARGAEPPTEQTPTAPESSATPDADDAEPDGAPPTEQSEAPKPRLVDVPSVPPLSEIEVTPSALAAVARIRRLSPEHAREIKPHLARLTRLRASMANPRKEAHKD